MAKITKTKKCTDCSTSIQATSGRKHLCSKCATERHRKRCRSYHLKNYTKKGYSQSGSSNNNWKGGIGIYRALKKAEECNVCGSLSNLLIHHIDGDRYNNNLDNLQCLCKRCHQIEHKCWEVLPRKDALSALKKEQAAKSRRDKKGRFTK